MTPEWLRESVLKGLQGMLVLRLQGSPASDTMGAVANAWIAILSNLPHTWDEQRDRPRLQRAFLTLATTCKYWPAPATLIEAMPKAEQPLKLDYPKGKYTPELQAAVKGFLNRHRM